MRVKTIIFSHIIQNNITKYCINQKRVCPELNMSTQAFQLESHPEIDWTDVEPLRQYEGKFPILDIKYQAKCKNLFLPQSHQQH